MSITTEPYELQLKAFFNILGEKRQTHEASMRNVNRFLSTGFNVFNYIQPDEPMLSRVLADLLNPLGSHGQGEAFYEAFAESLKRNDIPSEPPSLVETEWRTDRIENPLRRIDIVLAFGANYAIAIENKLDAADQPNQVRDYQRDLSMRFNNNYCLLYLTLDGHKPSKMSLGESEPDNDHLQTISYAEHIAPWINDCIHVSESDKLRWFLRDFQDHIERDLARHNLNGGNNGHL